jgi:hypothetical protein
LHFKTLSFGESVTLDNGTVVTPDQVLEKTVKAEACALFFVPTPDHLDSFLESNSGIISQLQQPQPNFNLSLFYHSVPLAVL